MSLAAFRSNSDIANYQKQTKQLRKDIRDIHTIHEGYVTEQQSEIH